MRRQAIIVGALGLVGFFVPGMVMSPPATASGNSCSAVMRLVHGGTFQMGKSGVATPVHRVTVDSYCMGVYEVTVNEYQSCVRAGKCKAPGTGSACQGTSFTPRNCVTWDDADAYCKWKGWRLPTEAEWEFAARAGSEQRTHSWGNDAPTDSKVCWKQRRTCDRFFGAKGAFNIRGLDGNVSEWVADRWGSYSSRPQTNPTGPSTGSERVVRGGNWNSVAASDIDTTKRTAYAQGSDYQQNNGYKSKYIGFRCAASPK